MNILFLNGSPKGNNSITIQTALYLEKRFPSHHYAILNIGQQIRLLEKDFTKVEIAIAKSDVIIFCYPVYTFIAPYQLHRFVELLKGHNLSFEGKFVSQITTSKHFYDITAHRYVEENCYDLSAKYIDGLSSDMDDLQLAKGREEIDSFFLRLLFDIENDIYKQKDSKKEDKIIEPFVLSKKAVVKQESNQEIVVLTCYETDENLENMIAEFSKLTKHPVRVVNLKQQGFTSGCIGCFSCSITGKCIHKDGFEEFLREKVQKSAAIITAFTIKNHYTDSLMKLYDDRQFCNGHRSVTEGKCTGYIISGNLKEEPNLQLIIDGRISVSKMYNCGIAETQKEIESLAKTVDFALEKQLKEPQNFLGVGGTKIFRDLVYEMQGLMQADHKFYKEHGIYDFPQKNKRRIWFMKALGFLMKNKKVKKKMQNNLNSFIVEPYKKVIANTVPINN